MSDDTMSLQEATNIGNELLVSGKITVDQLQKAKEKNDEYLKNGIRVRFGHICKELGFVTDKDLDEAEKAQHRARDTSATNEGEVDKALETLKNITRASDKLTTSRMKAVSI